MQIHFKAREARQSEITAVPIRNSYASVVVSPHSMKLDCWLKNSQSVTLISLIILYRVALMQEPCFTAASYVIH